MSALIWKTEVRLLVPRVGALQGFGTLGAMLPAAAHIQGQKWAHDGFVAQFGREPAGFEQFWVQLVAALESQYGKGWKGEGVGSNNMGAVQAGHAPCAANAFQYTDTHPNPDGTSTPYTICFRRYPTPVDGMADVARILFKQMKINAGSIRQLSTQMYDKHYYEGFGSTREQRINNHVKALTNWAKDISAATGQKMPPVEGGAMSSGAAAGASTGALIGGVALAGAAIYVLTKVLSRAA
jgi:hypothetical protein